MRQGPGWRQGSVAGRRPNPFSAPLPEAANRNKVSNRYFWNACKALSFGLLLMVIGTSMATIGYYADQLSVPAPARSNATVPVPRTKGQLVQLHNLSYAGPIVMGVGGFIMVAACVMTFEARDSAAKVVPSGRAKVLAAQAQAQRERTGHLGHGKLSSPAALQCQSSVRTDSRRSTAKWEQVYKVVGPVGSPAVGDRRALTQAFIQFSRNLQQQQGPLGGGGPAPTITKSPSAPNLADVKSPPMPPAPFPFPFQQSYVSLQQKRNRTRSPSGGGGGCALLNPHALLQRQAISMDNPDTYFSPPTSRQLTAQNSNRGSGESVDLEVGAMTVQPLGSQASMNIDLHLPNDCPVTLRIKDRSRRVGSMGGVGGKRHALVRQSQTIDDDDGDTYLRETHSCSPRLPGGHRPRTYDDEIRPYSVSTPHSRRDSLRAPATISNADKTKIRRSNSSDNRRDRNVHRSVSYEKRSQLEDRLNFQSAVKSDDDINKKAEVNRTVCDVQMR